MSQAEREAAEIHLVEQERDAKIAVIAQMAARIRFLSREVKIDRLRYAGVHKRS